MSAPANSTAPVNSKTNTSSINANNSNTNRTASAVGIILSVAGVIAIIAQSVTQLLTIDHGTSGQLTIDSAMNETIAIVMTSTIIIILGGFLFIYFKYASERPFLILFFVCLLSYLLSNIAIVLSLYQIHIS
jgi:hypothetical protein